MNKEKIIAEFMNADEDEAFKLVAALKVILLADFEANGGLTEASRKRAWKMVHELGQILLKRRSPQ